MEEMPARRIVDAYVEQVRPAYPGTMATVRNVSWWLAHGQTEEGLMRAVQNYAADMDLYKKQARYRKSPAGFFDRGDPTFTAYTAERGRPPTARRVAPPRDEKPAPVEQIRGMLSRLRSAVG